MPDQTHQGLYALENNDPKQQLFSTKNISTERLNAANEVMQAMGELRETERKLSEHSRKYMKLNETDMRAIHFIYNQNNQGLGVTAAKVAQFLKLSSASITKMIDRLEKSGHLIRVPHPSDRRATLLQVTSSTIEAAMHSMGKHQTARMQVTLELSESERKAVLKFLRNTTNAIKKSLENK